MSDTGLQFIDLGLVPYPEALDLQQHTVARVAAGAGEVVYLLEHPHVITLGRRANPANLLQTADPEGRPLEVVRISRGGDVTYHGPGQLVGYPHLDLRRRHRDLHRYLRDLEEVLIRTASDFGVPAFRRPGLTGVWTEAGKLASIGIGVRGWITLHGFALNVDPDLRYFRLLNPCGIPDCPMTSLAALTGLKVSVAEVKPRLAGHFRAVFTTTAVS
jgi:lipoyl(octanoyl) transferase